MVEPQVKRLDVEDPAADVLLRMHREMVRIRCFEERAAELLEAGEINAPTHLYTGQEAVAVGVCTRLRDDDYLLGNHRSHGHYLAKGGDMDALMAELYCKETGCAKGRGGSMHIMAPEKGVLGTVPMVAGTIPVAVGAALSAKMDGKDQVSVAFFGDSATEEGVFHEALNFASLYDLPMLFVCENNHFSSHLRLGRRRPMEELYKMAEAYPIESKRIDGNNVMEVFGETNRAVERARNGDGPTFLECVTHRWRGHVGPNHDVDVGIRDRDELEYWIAKCPIRRLERELAHHPEVDAETLEATWEEAAEEVEASVAFARESPEPDPDTVLDSVFVEAAP